MWEVLKVSDLIWVLLSLLALEYSKQSAGTENRVFLRQLWGDYDARSFSTSAEFRGALQGQDAPLALSSSPTYLSRPTFMMTLWGHRSH